MTDASFLFRDHAADYAAAGYWARPVSIGSKACFERNWQKPDDQLPLGLIETWLKTKADHGIGLLMGSPFPDGTTLGALDIDHDDYTRLGRTLLGDPPCGRFGSKGAVFFVRVKGELSNPEFRVKGDTEKRLGKVAECLFVKKLCVIPPTIHPSTGEPYRWIGRALLETRFEELPIVEM